MVARWNAVVAADDEVWHLGDFAVRQSAARMAELLEALAGTKHLIVGNNDGPATTALEGWASVQHYAEINIEGTWLILCHYPLRTWNRMSLAPSTCTATATAAWHLYPARSTSASISGTSARSPLLRSGRISRDAAGHEADARKNPGTCRGNDGSSEPGKRGSDTSHRRAGSATAPGPEPDPSTLPEVGRATVRITYRSG
jgi:hypothetical protein